MVYATFFLKSEIIVFKDISLVLYTVTGTIFGSDEKFLFFLISLCTLFLSTV